MKNFKIPPQLFGYALITLIVVWVLYLLLRRIGLIKDRAARMEQKAEIQAEKEIKQQAQLLATSEYFDPNLYKQTDYGYAILVPSDTVKKWAMQINDAWGWFNDDEEQVYDVFRNVPNKLTLSQLADMYSQIYKADLLADLVRYLNEDELAFIFKIIEKKPKGGR